MTATAPAPRLDDLAYITSETAATHETAAILDFVTRWLEHHDYHHALSCLNLLRDLKGQQKREDGLTPAILHELSQSCYTIALADSGYTLPDTEALLCLNFTHDLGEEFGVSREGLLNHWRQDQTLSGCNIHQGWLESLSTQFSRMAKKMNNVSLFPLAGNPTKTDHEQYFYAMMADPVTAMAKFLDRIHNMATMIGVKSIPKQREYLKETVTLRDILFLAAQTWPQYKPALLTMNKIVTTQILFTNRYLDIVDPENRRPLPFVALPRLHRMKPLPPGLDPLQITQARALTCIAWARAYQKPAPSTP
ncbi:MAG: hypothetical protein HYS17_01395 [Micavibrio aeruginosavorus]|uniref:Uncharacterized protein n=1 Tax=Micavibrio aeruginosavorus TaxID=349221 RepID=A0A7T5UHI8_9BACT|nr:MAG: hypothetical protein HYS17_01395 [Micavibrio aeruginosavorus]